MHRLVLALSVTLALLLGLSVGAGAAAAETISFDDLNAPGPGSGDGLPVNVQYENEGVTFNEPSALDYSKGEFGIPGFAHSGTVAVEACVGAEFCKAPIEAKFTAQQRSVRLWVGFDTSELSEPLGVRLTGYNGSTVVDSDEVTLPARSGRTPIQTPLSVEAASPEITKVRVTVSSGEGFTGGLAVDDLEFSTAGPPPPCNATAVPYVEFEVPPQSNPQLNEFVLAGNVVRENAPITSAQVIDKSSSPHSASAFPALIGPEGGKFGPVRFDGLLGPGSNEVVVTATNCRGTGTSSPRYFTLSSLDPSTKFHQLGMIEVNQSVQDTNNTVPLIAATPQGAKRTYARVYLSEEGTPSSVGRVSGTLTAVRPDGSRPPGPISVQSLNEISVPTGQTLEGARASLATSLNFELPPEWQAAGELHLELGHLEIEGTQSNFPCEGCANPGVNGPARIHFHSVPPMHIVLLNVPYMFSPEDFAPTITRQFDFEMLSSWLRRAYPSADIEITEETMPVQPERPGGEDIEGNRTRDGFLCHELNDRINRFVSTAAAEDPRARFYGMVNDELEDFMRGCSEIGGQVGSGPAGSSTFGWDGDGSYADWYGGHEIGHMFGRLHPGDCNQTDDDHSYPYPGGLIGDSAFDPQMLDTGDATLGGSENKIPPQVGDWHTGWHDVMTYCEKEWVSDYTYRGILQNLCGNDHPQCPEHALLSDVGGPRPRPRKSKRPTLLISGSLQLGSGRVSLDPLEVRHGMKLTSRPRKSPYAIELSGAGGRPLARFPFEPEELSDAPKGSAGEALFSEVVPFRNGARRIAISKGGRRLASVRVSAHAPSVAITAPRKGGKAHGALTLRWRGRDPDGGHRWYSVFYRPSPKRSIPVAADIRKTKLKVDLSQLPGGSHARFEVVASDGVLTGSDLTPALKVPFKSPRVSIVSPADGTVVPAGAPVGFQATVSDPQDVKFPPAKVVWSSSIQGALGQGQSISAALSPGEHRITVTATDSGGRSSSATVTVRAEAALPSVQAEILP